MPWQNLEQDIALEFSALEMFDPHIRCNGTPIKGVQGPSPSQITPEQERRFIDHYSQTGDCVTAAKTAGLKYNTARSILRRKYRRLFKCNFPLARVRKFVGRPIGGRYIVLSSGQVVRINDRNRLRDGAHRSR